MTLQEVIKGTLAWCNEQRAAREQEPLAELPKGQTTQPASCPCGKATGLQVYETYYKDENGICSDLPYVVQRFVRRFDAGDIPELVE